MDKAQTLYLRYQRPALGFLVLTVLAGVWLRAALLYPPLRLGLPFRFMVHAHSHVAFFGWVTMMLFGALLRAVRPAGATSFLAGHAVILALGSAAAFVAFLLGGYGAPAIALSALQVALWFAFAARTWRDTAAHPFWRAALALLVIAGLGTFAPMAVLVRGVGDPWWAEFAIKLFLIPFINGWLTLGVMAAVTGTAAWPGARAARWLVAAGALPSTLLFVAAPPPADALLLVGRAATAMVALGSVGFALGAWRARALETPWLRIGGAALALKGAIELLAAASVAPALMRHPQIVVAHLHLVLLGCVSALLLGAALRQRGLRAPAAAALFGAGVALMLAAIVTNAWARLFLFLAPAGLDLLALLRLALAGGTLAAAGAALAAHALVRTPAPADTPHRIARSH